MNMRQWTLWLLLVVMMSAAACGPAPAPTPDNALPQTFTSSNGTLSVDYPAGWIAADRAGGFVIANSQTTLESIGTAFSSGQSAMVALLLTADVAGTLTTGGVPLGDNLTPESVLGTFAEQSSAQLGLQMSAVTTFTLNGKAAARANLSLETGEGLFVTVAVENGAFVVFTISTAVGELAQYEQTFLDIAATVSYRPPQ
ncbi:MAG: hypothetical protein HXY40_16615 [Chloroflexi bacterium]|nr:hypothetical protein [Chloroflexota bacterium]